MNRLSILALIAAFSLTGTAKAQQFRFNPPVNLGPSINTEWVEADPYVTPDGQKLFFVSDRLTHSDNDIYMSEWVDSGWSAPVNLGPNVNSGTHEWSPSLSPDGKKLYFTAYGRPGSLGGWDIWCSNWDSVQQQWGPAENLGPVINSPYIDWRGKISYDGQSLYYMSNGKGHIQGSALYVSRWNGTGWTNPAPLLDNINNTATEEYPSLTLDEETMYFVRWLVEFGGGKPAICVTEKNSSGAWSDPVVLDSIINTQYGTSGPNITPNGSTLYFASGRPDGFGQADICVAERIILPTLGDLNLDGRISIADVMLDINKVFLDQPFAAEEKFGDVNCDNQFTPSDVVLLLNRTILQSPFPCSI